MPETKYVLEFHLRIRAKEGGYGGLEVNNTYDVEVDDLLAVLKIMAELEAHCKKLAESH